MLACTPIQHTNAASDASQAIAEAQRDAKLVNMQIWAFASGCTFSVIGILLAYVYPPQVPVERLIGKSPEYVASYTSTYQKIVRDKQAIEAALGCIAGGCAFMMLKAVVDDALTPDVDIIGGFFN